MTNKKSDKLPQLPKGLERYLSRPYGGLFGRSAFSEVVEEMVADPLHAYRPKELEETTGRSAPTIRRVLGTLTHLGLVTKDSTDRQHPIYRVDLGSRAFVALTFLALGVGDDRDGTGCMDEAIRNYYWRHLSGEDVPLAGATLVRMDLVGEDLDVAFLERYTRLGVQPAYDMGGQA